MRKSRKIEKHEKFLDSLIIFLTRQRCATALKLRPGAENPSPCHFPLFSNRALVTASRLLFFFLFNFHFKFIIFQLRSVSKKD